MTKKEQENKVEVSKITLKIDGETHAFTLDQCLALQKALNELFGKPIVKEVHHDHYYPYRTYDYWKPYPTWMSNTADNTHFQNIQAQANKATGLTLDSYKASFTAGDSNVTLMSVK